MEKKVLDFIFVPSGLVVMLSYHMWLLHRIMKHPNKTVIGINTFNRRFWVEAMMEVNSLALPYSNFTFVFVAHFYTLCFVLM